MSKEQQDTQYSCLLSEKPEGLHLRCLYESKPVGLEDTILVSQPVWTVSLGNERWNGKNFSLFL